MDSLHNYIFLNKKINKIKNLKAKVWKFQQTNILMVTLVLQQLEHVVSNYK